jgi:aldose 1-epimerase
MNILELSCGDLHLGVLPEMGGALSGLRHRDFDLLRPWDRTPSVRRSACYPLVPYSNRIANARFCVEGEQYTLARNFGEHPHSIHGLGWQRAWQVIEHSERSCLLRLSHDPDRDGGEHWPFAFEAEQRLSLDEQGLSLSLGLRNDSRGPQPGGLGWHPYFSRHAGIALAFEADAVWLSGDDGLPGERVLVPLDWQFSQRRLVGHVGLDNCFEGWKRQAHVQWPEQGIGLELIAEQGLDYLVVFTPPEPLDFIAVEPVSHLNNAINTAAPEANGIVWLAPGQRMERQLRINVTMASGGISA